MNNGSRSLFIKPDMFYNYSMLQNERNMYCMCDRKYLYEKKKPRQLTEDFISLFVEKNSDGTRNLRLKGNELQFRINRRVHNENMKMITNFLKKYDMIVHVDLSYNRIDDIGIKVLVDNLLAHHNNVEYLNISSCDIKEKGVEKLCNAWQTLKLKTLRLTGNKFGDHASEPLYTLLTKNRTLKHLDIAETDQTVISVPVFCAALRIDMGCNETLQVFDLSNLIPTSKFYQTQPTDLAEHMGTMLNLNRTLIELHIQKCGLDGHCIELLLKGLCHNKSLLLLDLGFNRIGNYGAELLANWFKSGPELIGINIAGNMISELGARALSFGLPFTKLRLLEISKNNISDRGLSEILLSIKKSQQIRLFYIFGNEIGPLSKEILERQLVAGVYQQANIDFQMFRTPEDLKIAHYPSNEYKHKFYNQLDNDDVRELRIRHNIIPGPYCDHHTKVQFNYYKRVDGDPECTINPQFDPTKAQEEALRKRCLERERKEKEHARLQREAVEKRRHEKKEVGRLRIVQEPSEFFSLWPSENKHEKKNESNIANVVGSGILSGQELIESDNPSLV